MSRLVAGLGLVALLCGCAPGEAPTLDEALPALPAHPTSARSDAGMVVTGSPHATEAGRRILAAGGNAVDAAVAAAFTLAVAEPSQSGLGGRTQILLRRADGSVHAVDGTTQVPAGYRPPAPPVGGEDGAAEGGLGAVAIPGTVAALARVLEEHGTLPLAAVLAPARSWAADGLELTAAESRRLRGVVEEAGAGSEVARVFAAGAQPGAKLVQAELAEVLGTLAGDGPDAFYRGSVADRIADDMEARGGFVTRADLAGYRALDGFVGRGRFRGHEVVGSYLPASGVTVVEILQILDRQPLPADEGRWTARVAEALLAGFADRERAEAMPPEVAVAWLTSDSLARRRAEEIRSRLDLASPRPPPAEPEGVPLEPPFTTHVSVADSSGMVVALTQSLGPTGGAKVVTPGLGFLYASTLGGYLAGGEPGYRPWSSQAPLLVLRDGEPRLVLGGAGARRILSAEVAVLVRILDRGTGVAEALAAPRLHPTGGELRVPSGWAGIDSLEALGYRVSTEDPGYFARLNVIEAGEGGAWVGHADPRWAGGSAAGPVP